MSRMTLRTKLAVAATVAAAGALPLQVGVAHADTPSDQLSACIRGAVAAFDTGTVNADGTISIDDDAFSTEVDSCVDAYMVALGVNVDATPTVDASATDPGTDVNTAILGTATGDTGMGTDDASVG